MGRIPLLSEFPPNITLSIVSPSKGSPINVLLLLHGLGDTHTSFTTLAKNLNLPETVCLSLRGPNPIPPLFTGSDTPAFHWGDDVLVDESRGEIEMDAGFNTIERMLGTVKEVLSKCGFKEREIVFFGFGQGGMAALDFVARNPEVEYGGVVSIGGRLPSTSTGEKGKTPVLVCAGSKSTLVTRSAVDKLKERFGDFEYVKWAKADDSMMKNRDEMMPIMKFFARRLRSRAGVPEGAVEV